LIGLDTNVLIRYIVRDDHRQAEAATRLIESKCTAEDPGIISPIVLCELVWVLSRGYGYQRPVVAKVVRRLLSVKEIRVTGAESAWRAIRLFDQGKVDFADYMIGLSNQGEKTETTYTFDRTAAESELFKIVPI
jgi:predicted nucleic-acid-binding protein